MLNVVFDTNALIRLRVHHPGWVGNAIIGLAVRSLIRLWVPDLVVQEYISRSIEREEQDYRKLHRAAEKVKRKWWASALAADLARITAVDLTEIRERTTARERLHIERAKIDVIPHSDCDASLALRSYFAGTPPFSNRRQKDHLLDAVIYESVLRLRSQLQKGDPIVFVSGDKILRQAVERKGVETLASHDGILGLSGVQAFDVAPDFESWWSKHFLATLSDSPALRKLEWKLLDDLLYDMLIGMQISEEGDLRRTDIRMVMSGSPPRVAEGSITSLGPGRYEAKLSYSCDCMVVIDCGPIIENGSVISYSDIYDEIRQVDVTGRFAIKLPEDVSHADLSDDESLASFASHSACELLGELQLR